jgi:hypothetical protein
MQELSERGAWEPWLEFFLDGVAETAIQAFSAATRIVDLFKADRTIAGESERAGSALPHPRASSAAPISHRWANRRADWALHANCQCPCRLERPGLVEKDGADHWRVGLRARSVESRLRQWLFRQNLPLALTT